MYFNFYYLFLFLRKYIKQKDMRLLLTFIIFILGGFYTFGKENYCEECCEYLGIFCNKGKGEEENKDDENSKKEEEDDKNNKKEEKKEENEGEKKEENEVQEEAKNLVNENWLDNKKNNGGLVLKIFNKDENENENVNEYKSGNITINLKKEDGKTKITKLVDVEENLKTNGQKWALFEIRYKKGTGNEEENKEETKYLYCSDIESTLHNGIFYNCKQHISISVIACDTSGVRDMYHMFSDCEKLNNLNLSNFNTSNVTNMGNMFASCFSLQQLDLSNFNTNKVITMRSIFFNCSSLTKLNLSNFNTSNVTNMGSMFSFCSLLKNLEFGNKFNTNNVTNMSYMFSFCSSLQTLDLSNFNTDNVTDMSYMFFNCSSLQTVTFNKSLSEGIKQQLKDLGLTEEVKEEEGNKITLKKKPQT